MRQINFFVIALLFIAFSSIINAQSTQRTKIAIVGLVHSHCWGFVTKLNQMHQQQDLIEIVGISDDNQELREYIKTLVPGVPVYDNYKQMLDEKKPEVVWSFVENDRHLEVTKACAARKIHVMFEKPMWATYDEARQWIASAITNPSKASSAPISMSTCCKSSKPPSVQQRAGSLLVCP